MLLHLHNVSKTYAGPQGQVAALADVLLAVDAGEFVAVQGPSGCGKSTLLLVAGGLLGPDSGDVTIDGRNPYALSADARAAFRGENIGFVFQQFHLIPYLSVLDNVLAPTLAAASAERGTRSAELRAPSSEFRAPADRARDLIERFGLSHRMHHVPGELSSGERQRTALARALLNHPKLVLADEPTGNLDRENADAVLGFLSDFAREGGGVLLVTHDPSAAERAHRIVTLSNGRIVAESGKPKVESSLKAT